MTITGWERRKWVGKVRGKGKKGEKGRTEIVRREGQEGCQSMGRRIKRKVQQWRDC
jgi:hypothetical protein